MAMHSVPMVFHLLLVIGENKKAIQGPNLSLGVVLGLNSIAWRWLKPYSFM